MNLFGKKYECQQCSTTFKSESELAGHSQIHSTPTQDHSGHEHFTCNACGASFHSKTELGEHGQRYHM
ncbi:MAG: C2H2-type zinc finger protein [Nitrososphaera sp.]